MLECYRKFFKLDEFNDEYLAIKPIELTEETIYYNENIEEKVDKANIDFVRPLVKMMLNK